MPLDSGRFPRKHAKYTVVLEKYSWLSADKKSSDNRLSADTSFYQILLKIFQLLACIYKQSLKTV